MSKRSPALTVSLAAALALAASLPVRAEAMRQLTLKDAVSLALANSPVARQVEAGRAVALSLEREAYAGKLPRVELSSTLTHGDNPVYVFGSLLEQGEFSAKNFAIDKLNDPSPVTNVRTAVSAQLSLYDGGQVDVGVSRAKLEQERAVKRGLTAGQYLRFEVIRAYYGLLVAVERESVTRDAARTAEANADRIRSLHEAGVVVVSDLLAAQVQLAGLKQSAIEAAAEIAVAKAALNVALGLKGEEDLNLTDPLPENVAEPGEDQRAVAAAIANRPELREAEVEIRVGREKTRGARTQYLPRVDAFANYGVSSETVGLEGRDWMAGVRVSFPLFDGGRDHRVEAASAAEEIAKNELESVKRRVTLEAVAANQRLKAARERLKVASGAIGLAVETERIVQDRYREGLTTITEVLRAQSAVLGAKLDHTMARYGVCLGWAELLRATGNLNDIEAFKAI